MTDAPTNSADAATSAAIDAHISGQPIEKAAPLFNRASAEHERAARAAETGPRSDDWRNDNIEAVPLSPMPAPPSIEQRETQEAIETLRNYGGDHAALVDSWAGDFSQNLAFAKQAFHEIATPSLIQKFDESGLGNDPAVLEFLAKHGRLSAGFSGDFAPRNQPSSFQQGAQRRMSQAPSGSASAARAELQEIMETSPPGSAKYASPAVQRRVTYLHQQIAGTGVPVGKGGRTA